MVERCNPIMKMQKKMGLCPHTLMSMSFLDLDSGIWSWLDMGKWMLVQRKANSSSWMRLNLIGFLKFNQQRHLETWVRSPSNDNLFLRFVHELLWCWSKIKESLAEMCICPNWCRSQMQQLTVICQNPSPWTTPWIVDGPLTNNFEYLALSYFISHIWTIPWMVLLQTTFNIQPYHISETRKKKPIWAPSVRAL